VASSANGTINVAASSTAVKYGRGVPNGANVLQGIWGQSNAIARGDQSDLSLSPLTSDPELAQYMNGTIPFTRAFMWTGAQMDVLTASNTGADPGQFGPEFAQAVAWHRKTTSGGIYFIKEAVSGAPIGTTFNHASPTYGYLYTAMKTQHLAALAWLASHGVTIARTDWLWVQGEADYLQTEKYYYDLLASLIARRLADGLTTTASRLVLAKMKVGSLVWAQSVDDAKEHLASDDPARIKTVRMDYYKSAGDAHLNGRGVVQLGYDAFEKFYGESHVAT